MSLIDDIGSAEIADGVYPSKHSENLRTSPLGLRNPHGGVTRDGERRKHGATVRFTENLKGRGKKLSIRPVDLSELDLLSLAEAEQETLKRVLPALSPILASSKPWKDAIVTEQLQQNSNRRQKRILRRTASEREVLERSRQSRRAPISRSTTYDTISAVEVEAGPPTRKPTDHIGSGVKFRVVDDRVPVYRFGRSKPNRSLMAEVEAMEARSSQAVSFDNRKSQQVDSKRTGKKFVSSRTSWGGEMHELVGGSSAASDAASTVDGGRTVSDSSHDFVSSEQEILGIMRSIPSGTYSVDSSPADDPDAVFGRARIGASPLARAGGISLHSPKVIRGDGTSQHGGHRFHFSFDNFERLHTPGRGDMTTGQQPGLLSMNSTERTECVRAWIRQTEDPNFM